MSVVVRYFVLSLFFLPLSSFSQDKDYVDYVNPLIGAHGEGHTFPGVSMPFGMVKLGPDVGDKRSNSGYKPEGKIHGFSHVHVSGTGGGAKYGNVLMTPLNGKLTINNYASKRANETFSAGHYSVDLVDHHTQVDLSASHSVGFHKYTFQKKGINHILIDAGSFLGEGHCCGEAQVLVGSEVKIVSPTKVEGYTRVQGGWNKGEAYTVYFSAEFDKAAQNSGVWKNDDLLENQTLAFDTGKKTGAYFSYDLEADTEILVKVGISFISTGKAHANIVKEAPHWDFNKTVNQAKVKWNKALKAIDVDGTEDRKTIFYTALYHSMLMPTDRTGENPNWQSEQPYYDDYYAIWDTFRATHPLLTLIQPQRQVDMINSLIDTYKHDNYFPDSRSGNATGVTQGGSNVDMLISDAYLKGLEGIDYAQAYQGIIKNAEVAPGDDERKYGRGGLSDYNTLGYVSTDHERAGTRTVEYAANDWAIALLAKGLGKQEDYQKYKSRAGNWVNLWRDIEDLGFRGFVMPRASSGEWVEDFANSKSNKQGSDKATFSTLTKGTWPDFFYESHSWEYSLYVPHDVRGLINKAGGNEVFTKRLDTFFNKGYYDIGNEPSFLAPVLYLYAGRHDKTAEKISSLLRKHYKSSPDGLPGNDDAGSMSAWFAFHAMGFYPNAGQDVYLISTPLFKKSTIHLSNHQSFTIEAKNWSEDNIYVERAELNGRTLDQVWFRHSDIKNGAQLVLYMSDKPTAWGTKNPPPSMSDKG